MAEQLPRSSFEGHIESSHYPEIVENLTQQIRESPLSRDSLELEQEVLRRRREISNQPFFHLPLPPDQLPWPRGNFRMVLLEQIVGGVGGYSHWGQEYRGRDGRHFEVVRGLLSTLDEEDTPLSQKAVNRVFHFERPWSKKRIRLLRLNGRVGPVFFIVDGSHRVSACKVLGLREIPCETETFRIQKPSIWDRWDRKQLRHWRRLRKAGLVE